MYVVDAFISHITPAFLFPVVLPYFYLLAKAMKTHLCQMETVLPERAPRMHTFYLHWRSRTPIRKLQSDPMEKIGLVLSNASSDCIAIAAAQTGVSPFESRATIGLWDLETKQLVREIPIPELYCLHKVFLVDDLVVCCGEFGYDVIIQVYSRLDGQLANSYSKPPGIEIVLEEWIEHKGMIFFVTFCFVHAFDPRSGTFRKNLMQTVDPSLDDYTNSRFLTIAETGWLVVMVHLGDETSEIHIFDLNDCCKIKVLRGEQYQDCDKLTVFPQKDSSNRVLYYRKEQAHPDILDLNDGSFTPQRVYSLPSFVNFIIPLTEQYFLAHLEEEDETMRCVIYNTQTGEKVRQLGEE